MKNVKIVDYITKYGLSGTALTLRSLAKETGRQSTMNTIYMMADRLEEAFKQFYEEHKLDFIGKFADV